jgi:hypothetical protein
MRLTRARGSSNLAERVVEKYRGCDLVVASQGTNFVGKAWRAGKSITKLEGSDIASVLAQLKAKADDLLNDLAQNAPDPLPEQYVDALKQLLPSLSTAHLAMLKAHYRAADRSLTATQLAKAAGYAGYASANLQYGLMARNLWEALPTRLPTGPDGQPIYTYALADEGDRSGSEAQWVWKLRPAVAAAMATLGLQK